MQVFLQKKKKKKCFSYEIARTFIQLEYVLYEEIKKGFVDTTAYMAYLELYFKFTSNVVFDRCTIIKREVSLLETDLGYICELCMLRRHWASRLRMISTEHINMPDLYIARNERKCTWYIYTQRTLESPCKFTQPSQLAFYVNLHRAVIGPSATLTGR